MRVPMVTILTRMWQSSFQFAKLVAMGTLARAWQFRLAMLVVIRVMTLTNMGTGFISVDRSFTMTTTTTLYANMAQALFQLADISSVTTLHAHVAQALFSVSRCTISGIIIGDREPCVPTWRGYRASRNLRSVVVVPDIPPH
jgi:hypothetical protein